MGSREEFLERVQHAALAGRAYRVRPEGDVTDRSGYVGVAGDLCAHLAREIETVGGVAQRVADDAGAREAIAALVRARNIRSAIAWQHPLLDRLGLAALLAREGISLRSYDDLAALPAAEQRERLLAAELGVTSVDWAIAETGTLAVFARPGQERVASLLPPVHIAIVERRQVLADLFDLFAKLAAAGYDSLPSNLALITGPSKTGDIELTLTTGVHGPGLWHVVVIEN